MSKNVGLNDVLSQVEKLKSKMNDSQKPNKTVQKGAPAIRTGEDPLSSRPFYISEVAKALLTGDWDNAKHEKQELSRFKKAMGEVHTGFSYGAGSIVLPLSWELLPREISDNSDFTTLKKSMGAGAMKAAKADPNQFLRESGRVFKKAPMSMLDQSLGGAVIQPPEFGELIPVLRNKSVLNQIGAKQVALPPQGSVAYPRQTSASTAEQIPENPATGIVESDFGTDQLTLSAKTFAGMVKVSNQLLRFSQGVAESLIRDDMMAQVALYFDKAGLEGVGGPNKVQGIINSPGITTVVASTAATDGNTWQPKDLTRMIAAAMAKNSDIDLWVLSPGMFLGMTETRTGGSTTGDGPYLFDLIRTLGQDIPDKLRGRPVYTSNQVSLARAKGSGTNLTYVLGLKPEEIVIALHGAVELSVNTQAESVFSKNQSLLRVLMYGDVGVRRGAGVTFMDTLLQLSI